MPASRNVRLAVVDRHVPVAPRRREDIVGVEDAEVRREGDESFRARVGPSRLPRSFPVPECEATRRIADDLDTREIGFGGALEPVRATAVIDGDVTHEPTGRGTGLHVVAGREDVGAVDPRRREAVAIEVVGERR